MSRPLDGSESILCVPSASLVPLGLTGAGFFRLKPEMGATLDLVLADARFLPRTDALELDESWLQLVGYVIPHSYGRVLTYRRGKGGAESRLHDRRTFGSGGHWNRWDNFELPRSWGLGAGNCARREIIEEFGVTPTTPLRPVGFVRDDRDAVGRVHLGCVIPWAVPDHQRGKLRYGAGIDFLGWADGREVRRHKDWESWSEILTDHLGTIIGEPPAVPAPASGLAMHGAPAGGRPGLSRGESWKETALRSLRDAFRFGDKTKD